MSNRKQKSRQPDPATLSVVHRHAAGIDVGHADHHVCVGDDPAADVRRFGSFTSELRQLAAWLTERGVTTVAMEATGVYWIPLYELLASRGFEVLLVDPRQTSARGCRPKTDVADCQWIRRLHAHGLLTGSFRPDDAICVLRCYLRRRLTLAGDAGRCIQQMHKALDQMNVKLHLAISDVTGKTGQLILRAILAGRRDPRELAKHRDRRCRHSEETIAQALEGNWREEHLFELRQAVEAWDFCQQQIRDCDEQLERVLHTLPVIPGAKAKPRRRLRGRKPNEPLFDVRSLLAQIAGMDLTAIEGIDETLALTIVAEIGVDLSAFPSEKHFGSWLGVAPNPQRSGRHLHRSRTKPTANRAAKAFRLAAQAVSRSHTALGAFYRRLKSRLGGPKAITATAYKIAKLVYRLLTKGEEYVAKGLAVYEAETRQRAVKALERRARDLGFQILPQPPAVPRGG